MSHKLYVVGIGPGEYERMTLQAIHALEKSDIIVGYPVYVDLVKDHFPQKEFLTTPMRQEEERCRMALAQACEGKVVALICSGDAGVYGMAGLVYELQADYPTVQIEIIAGVTAASSGAAVLGAPLIHDFAVISLSDLMTPWETIAKRLRAAAGADLCIVLYNPSSHRRADYLQRACDILLEVLPDTQQCGFVENIGRENTVTKVCSLGELRTCTVNMFTTVFIGNASTKLVQGKMVTPRGYEAEKKGRKE